MSTGVVHRDNSLCRVCAAGTLRRVAKFDALARITSDCRPFSAGGKLYVCGACGAVQKAADPEWLREIVQIYAGYEAYYQSGGDEQIVFDRIAGEPRRRSDVLLDRLFECVEFAEPARALDVGCGHGVTLRSASERRPGWELSGFEIGGGTLPRLQRIPGFASLYTGSLAQIDGQFDLVTMIHSLEHFPSPEEVLVELRKHVKSSGFLFIEVCNVEENPFDILVADHLMHFSPRALAALLGRAGLRVTRMETTWVAKEISAIADLGATNESDLSIITDPDCANREFDRICRNVAWLEALIQVGLEASINRGKLGLFGTSIAATWLASALGDRVAFFVDEDPSRVGKLHLGRPIISPPDVPGDGVVLLALAPAVAAIISRRIAALPISIIMPPPIVNE